MLSRRAACALILVALSSTFLLFIYTFFEQRVFVFDSAYQKADTPKEDLSQSFFRYKSFCVQPHVLSSEMLRDIASYSRITLVIHTSADYLDDHLVEQVNSWDGPVSLSVFLPRGRVAVSMAKAIKKLAVYRPKVITKLSVHFFFYGDPDCTAALNGAPADDEAANLYPANVARNIARLLSSTKYILLTDCDFVSSKNFEAQMRKLADDVLQREPKTALVFRIFEFNDTIEDYPRDKERLYELYKRGDAVEFHAKYYRDGHGIGGLIQWFQRNVSESAPTLSDIVPYRRYMWEPQFVSLSTIPLHDENFPYPVRDNTVLRWEMCRMNYTFRVADNVFMVHRGIKTTHGKSQKLKKVAMPIFSEAVKKFAQRMDELFPETKTLCPSTYRA